MTEGPSTERLRAQPLSLAHEEELAALHADERVMATIGGTRDREASRAWIERNLRHSEEDGLGIFVFRERGTGRFVGRGAIRRMEVGGRPEVEIGYVIAADLWGRGLATEMARGLAAFAEGSGLHDLAAFTLPANMASRRVMEKVGFTYEREVEQWGEVHVLYRRRRRA